MRRIGLAFYVWLSQHQRQLRRPRLGVVQMTAVSALPPMSINRFTA